MVWVGLQHLFFEEKPFMLEKMCSTKSSRLRKKTACRYLQTLDECARHTTESIQAWRGLEGHVGGELEGKSPTFEGPKVTSYKGPPLHL